MKKAAKTLLALPLAILALASCETVHNERGYVIDKTHRAAYYTYYTTLVYNGKSYTYIRWIIHHAESWSLDLRDEDAGEWKYYTVYLRDPDVWEQVEIGDYFVWDTSICFDCEPTTRTRGS